MPQVPRVREQSVALRPVSGVRVSTDAPLEAFGGGAAVAGVERATQGVVGVFDKIVQDEKRRADQVSVLEADQKLSALETRLLHDPEAGALNKRGKDAFGLPETVMGDFGKGVEEIEAELGNDDQRMAFRRMVVQRQSDIDRNLQRHVSGEMRRHDDQTTESYLANERDAAAANYKDDDRVAMAIGRQRAAVVDHAQRNGLPEEYIKQKTAEVTSQTLSTVVTRMVSDGDDLAAKKYYETNRDLFTGRDQERLVGVLEEASLRGESQRNTDAIVAKAPTMTAALEEARKIEEPKLRDETTRRVREFYGLKKQAEEEARAEQFQYAANVLEQTGGNRDQIPADVWMNLSLSERNAIDARAKQLREGIPPTTDWGTYYELKTLASDASTRAGFLKTNLIEHRHKLGDAEFKDLVNLQAQLRRGDDSAETELMGYRTTQQIVSQALGQAGIDASPKPGSKDAARLASFARQVDEQIVEIQERTGKKATTEERQRIVDNLMVKGAVERGWLWDTRKPVFEAEPGDEIEVQYEDVPAREKSYIEAALKARGLPVDERTVTEMYRRKIQRVSQNGAQ